MPSRKVHNRVAERLGIDAKLADEINRMIDEPSKWLGPSHRVVRHDPAYAAKLVLKTKKPEAAKAWAIHVALDRISEDKNARRAFKILDALL